MPKTPTQKTATAGNAGRKNPPAGIAGPDLLALYRQMVLLRQFELAAQANYKRGEMPGFIHLYVGEEAVAVGICAHLDQEDWITSTHRGHGHVLAKGTAPRALMAELYAKATGCCGGRGGSMHLYDRAHGVFGTNGIVGGGIPHAVGAAISSRVRGKKGISAAFFGDGAVNHGAFHEALNFAGAQSAGVVFVCENNLYATATPLRIATRNAKVASKAAAYGVPGVVVDGNDVLAVWTAARDAVARARKGEGPTLIEARTYRTVGHHEGDPLVGTYRTQEELDGWKQRCPILNFRRKLIIEGGTATASELDKIDAEVKAVIDDAVEFARKSPFPETSTFFDHSWSDGINPAPVVSDPTAPKVQRGWLDAVRDGIAEEMRRDPNIIYFGEGIGERGGSFAHTKGLWKEFGGVRVMDTPICELGFTGAAIGASATGCRAIADLMFADFLFETGGQIPLQAAKLRYMSNGGMAAPVVLRAPCGAIKSAGPQHSGTYHAMWSHLPGLIVVMPSNPSDAKGLMKNALRSSDPVLFLEPKALFSSKGDVPEGEYLVPFGEARMARSGSDSTIVAAGRMVSLCLEAASKLAENSIECEVIDLRSIVPLDTTTIVDSVTRTGRLVVVDEGYSMCGLGAEIVATVMELAPDALEAPACRLHMEPVAHPFNPGLEETSLPSVDKIIAAVRIVIDGATRPSRRPSVRLDQRGTVDRESDDRERNKLSSSARLETGRRSAAEEPVIMPFGDLTVSEAKVVGWLKNPGDSINAGEAIAEVETDKAILQIEAPANGRLIKILIQTGQMAKMGETLATYEKEP